MIEDKNISSLLSSLAKTKIETPDFQGSYVKLIRYLIKVFEFDRMHDEDGWTKEMSPELHKELLRFDILCKQYEKENGWREDFGYIGYSLKINDLVFGGEDYIEMEKSNPERFEKLYKKAEKLTKEKYNYDKIMKKLSK